VRRTDDATSERAAGAAGAPAPEGTGPRLKRSLSLPLVTLYGLGTTVGAGIYVLVGKVAGRAELLTPAAFAVAAVLAGLTAFSFAELAARYPKSAGEALYVRAAFGRRPLALAVGLLVALSGTVSAAAIALGAAGYLGTLVELPAAAVVVLLVLGIGALAAWGIAESVTLAAVLTLVEVGGLVLVVVTVALWLPDRPAPLPRPGALLPPFEAGAWSAVLAGAVLAFYAFIGFEDMVNVAEEVKDAPRTLPLAIVVTLALTTLLYVAVALVAVLALPPAELAASAAPLAELFERAGGSALAISLIAILATLNGALIQIIMAARILYGLSEQGALPAALGRVHATTRTPLLATAVVALAVMALAVGLPIEPLAEATSVVVLAVFTLVNLALLRLKRRAPHPAGVWRVPWPVPLGGFLASAAFLGFEALRLLGIG
jgi:amino acid transporter